MKKASVKSVKIAQSCIANPKSKKKFKEFCILNQIKIQKALSVLVVVASESLENFKLFTSKIEKKQIAKTAISIEVAEGYSKKTKAQFKYFSSKCDIPIEISYGALFEFVSSPELFEKYIVSRMKKES